MVVYLNEQKTHTLSAAAVAADEYVLIHQSVFPSLPQTSVTLPPTSPSMPPSQKNAGKCFYCHKPSYVIANCLSPKIKEQAWTPTSLRPKKWVLSTWGLLILVTLNVSLNVLNPFCSMVMCHPYKRLPVCILMDTACSQSVILSLVLPVSEQSACGFNTELCGVDMGRVLKPVHMVHITFPLISGHFPVAISWDYLS